MNLSDFCNLSCLFIDIYISDRLLTKCCDSSEWHRFIADYNDIYYVSNVVVFNSGILVTVDRF